MWYVDCYAGATNIIIHFYRPNNVIIFCVFVADQNTAGSVTGDVMTEQQSNTPLPSGVPENVQVYLNM